MFSVSWIDESGALHFVNTPNEDAAYALYGCLLDGWFLARLWHTVTKGQPKLLA